MGDIEDTVDKAAEETEAVREAAEQIVDEIEDLDTGKEDAVEWETKVGTLYTKVTALEQGQANLLKALETLDQRLSRALEPPPEEVRDVFEVENKPTLSQEVTEATMPKDRQTKGRVRRLELKRPKRLR